VSAPENTSPADRLLDLFVFAPAGLALTLVEELPNLVEKGRNRIEGRTATARVVGQFVVQMGFREVSRRARQLVDPEPPKRREAPPQDHRTDDGPPSSPSVAPTSEDRRGREPVRAQPAEPAFGEPESAETESAEPESAETESGQTEEQSTEIRVPYNGAGEGSEQRNAESNGIATIGDLAIPAYDTLSASQVVKRLDGLSREELREVGEHERQNRHRATILTKVEQLLSGEPAPDA